MNLTETSLKNLAAVFGRIPDGEADAKVMDDSRLLHRESNEHLATMRKLKEDA